MSSNTSDDPRGRRLPRTAVPIDLLLFLALAGYAASLVALFVHEVVGHGLVALLVGGTFEDFYVSPLEGLAATTTPDARSWVVTASGAVVTILFGLLLWRVVRRRIGSPAAQGLVTTILLWCIANEAVIDPFLYMTMQPTLGWLVGVESGDWLSLIRDWSVPPLLWLSGGLVLGVPVCALFMQDAHRIVGRCADASWSTSPLRAYWLLTVPGSALQLLYLVVVLPWRGAGVAMALGSALGVPAFGVLGALWLRLRGHRARAAEPGPPNSRPRLRTGRVAAGLATLGLAVAWIFGPSVPLRRGVAVGPPNPDVYLRAAQDLDMRLELTDANGARLFVESSPRPTRGRSFRRRVTDALAASGPSIAGAEHATRFIAQWNLDGAIVRSVEKPRRTENGWAWSAELDLPEDSLMVRLWPLTWISESHVASLRIVGGEVQKAGARVRQAPGGAIVWTRPPEPARIDSFLLRAR